MDVTDVQINLINNLEFVDNGGIDGTDVQINLINNLEFVDNGSLDGTDVQVNLINNLPVSVADPYHFDTDPDLDPGCEKFVTDPDPGRTLIRIMAAWMGLMFRSILLITYLELVDNGAMNGTDVRINLILLTWNL